MQELLDGQEQIIAGIRDRDAEGAERDLYAYDGRWWSLDDSEP